MLVQRLAYNEHQKSTGDEVDSDFCPTWQLHIKGGNDQAPFTVEGDSGSLVFADLEGIWYLSEFTMVPKVIPASSTWI